MRQTSLSAGEQRITIQTNEQGTQVLGSADEVLGNYGTDRHEEMVDKYESDGWSVTASGDVRPVEAGPPTTQPNKDDGGDGSQELDLGISS
jgi:hypothetical protein